MWRERRLACGVWAVRGCSRGEGVGSENAEKGSPTDSYSEAELVLGLILKQLSRHAYVVCERRQQLAPRWHAKGER